MVEEKDHFVKFRRWLETERGEKWASTGKARKFINYVDVLKKKIAEELRKKEEEEAL